MELVHFITMLSKPTAADYMHGKISYIQGRSGHLSEGQPGIIYPLLNEQTHDHYKVG